VDPAVYRLLDWSPKPVSDEEIVERCWLQMLNETARCMEEGIIKDPADVDIGVIFGFGFPPFRGGLLQEADRHGLAWVVSKLDGYAAKRERMVTDQIAARGIRDPRVLDAMRRVPREEFVRQLSRSSGYEDHPLPIAEGQTISQPYIVALTVEGAQVDETSRVLDVGTGSAYAAAVRGHECVHDGQAEPGAARVGTTVDARELLEDALALLGRHAGTMVGDAHLDLVGGRSRAAGDQDLRAGWREAQRVLEQVAEDLFHHLHVDLDVGELGRHVEAHPVRARQRSQPADGRLREVTEVDGLAPHLQPARADAEVEHV
jgi:hypothetical protein